MNYASEYDMINFFGYQSIVDLTNTDPNATGIDNTVLNTVLNQASREVETYFSKYQLPLLNGTVLVFWVAHIARYLLDPSNEEYYAAALNWLQEAADKNYLGLTEV